MDVDIEMMAKDIGLVIHDKIFNQLNSAVEQVNIRKCIEHRYTVKSHECLIVMVKY